ncbi:MAG: leucine--tRNA ligase [Nanoarchaeota archaeon]
MNEQNQIAKKWQKRWEDAKLFEVKEEKKNKFYSLDMFLYPSGKLHMGHTRTYAISDCYTRFKRMQGFNVLHPIGYDSLGLPAENAAIKNKVNPKLWTEKSIDVMKNSQKDLGFSYDWSRELRTYDSDYQKWEQWLFLKFYEKGLAYRKKAFVNWCPNCMTVLANEQVENGKCWRCHSEVDEKELEQWFFKITEYAERLLKDIDKLKNWPEKVKTMQRNWIGKSNGTEIEFKIKGLEEKIPVFTTRADTIFGVTYIVLAPENPLADQLSKDTPYEKKVKKFIQDVKKESKIDRMSADKEKRGCFTGAFVINPLNNEEVPIYIADYVLPDYGTGAIMGVPAHDQRDFEFAKKYDLSIRVVITPSEKIIDYKHMKEAYIDEGILTNSSQFNGINSLEAIDKISGFIEKSGFGKITINYKLRDWLISRQRYWGTPIPIIYCDKCGIVPVPEKYLPILLPQKVEFNGRGNPLDTGSFTKTKCPKCKGDARRETDTMDTFVDSSWYFLRYCSPRYKEGIFDKKAVKYWMPVDAYIGGIEHAIGHLFYSRFFTKVMNDMKLLDFDEPFNILFLHGMVLKDGEVMSKSKGNVIDPWEVSEKYGIDTLRTFLLFGASPEKDMEWSDEGINGISKILNKVKDVVEFNSTSTLKTKDEFLISKMHSTIKKVTDHFESFEFNSALIAIFDYLDYIKKNQNMISKEAYKKAVETLLLMLAPYAPHISEEYWGRLGNKTLISISGWPKFDSKKINPKYESIELMIERVNYDINSVIELTKIKPSKITLFVAEPWKFEFFEHLKKNMEKTRNISDLIKGTLRFGDEKEIPKLITSILKDPSKMPMTVLDEKTEYGSLNQEMDNIAKRFGAQIEVIKASESQEQKAKQALPGKPAILIK